MAFFLSLLSSVSTVINAVAKLPDEKECLFLQTLGCKILYLFLCFQSWHCWSIKFTLVNFSLNKETRQKEKNPRGFDCLIQFRINFHPSYALLNVRNSPECLGIAFFSCSIVG